MSHPSGQQQQKPKQVIVTVRCVVVKEVVCENCTVDEARTDPFEHAVDETEMYQEEWEVTSVREDNQ